MEPMKPVIECTTVFKSMHYGLTLYDLVRSSYKKTCSVVVSIKVIMKYLLRLIISV
jgi:hypothetical protein